MQRPQTVLWYGLEDLSCPPAVHGSEYDQIFLSLTQEMLLFSLVEKSHGPGRSCQYPLGPWRVPFSQSFSRTELATTKIAKVTRDNDLTSQEEFFLLALEARPRHRRDPERAANMLLPRCASQWSPYPAVTRLVSCSPERYEKFWTSAEKFKTSPLVPAHPSWSLTESRSEIFAHSSSTLGPHQIFRGGSMPFLAPLRLNGHKRTPSVSSSTTPSGASWVMSTVRVCGVLLAARPWALPSASSNCSVAYVYEAYPLAEVRRLRFLLREAPLSLFPLLVVPPLLRPLAVGTSSGAVGRVSRLGRTSSLAIASRTSSFQPISSAGSPGSGAAGCVIPAATA